MTSRDKINSLIDQLNLTYTNLSKAPNRIYRRSTIKSKLKLTKQVYEKIQQNLQEIESEIPTDKLEETIKSTKLLYSKLYLILQDKLANSKPTLSFKSSVYVVIFTNYLTKKLKMPFDIKTATAIVQPYDGTPDHLDSFIDAATLLKDYITADQIPIAVKFLKTRLTGKARIGLPGNLNTIDDVINDIKARCKDHQTPENIIAKIKNIKQKTDTNSLCDEIDALTMKLKRINLQQGIPEGVSQAMATKTGVDALINSVNSETRLILKAGTFNNIKDAIQKVQENASQYNTPQIMTINSHRNNNYERNGRGNRPYRGNSTSFRGRFNSSHRGNNRFQNNFRTNPNTYQRSSNYYPPRNNFGGRRDTSRRVYTIQTGHPQPIQSFPVNFSHQMTTPQNTPHAMAPQYQQQPNFQQPHFFGQVPRGPLPSSQ